MLLFIKFVPTMVDEKKLKTVKNYAKKQGFHRNWIYQLINKGELPFIKIDGVVFVNEEKK